MDGDVAVQERTQEVGVEAEDDVQWKPTSLTLRALPQGVTGKMADTRTGPGGLTARYHKARCGDVAAFSERRKDRRVCCSTNPPPQMYLSHRA